MKKLIFILLMSGVILSPLGVYAMNEEPGAPSTSVSKTLPPDIQQLEKKVIQGREEQIGKHPGWALLPPSSYLSPEEGSRYNDYFNQK
ncbi:hypothetical protein QPK87_21360 [Kamptonema cortianum]|jgi:hypothetical protein|nr:hypothetical protein [Geitlerinema splendidum]MDK3159103.1 hypothetical protein [Kamptonema cortianum]